MKKFAFIGQAMPKPPYPDLPFGRTKLYEWFDTVGIPKKYIETRFYFSAIVSYFPGSKNGSHIIPSEKEVLAERPVLKSFLDEIKPDIIVPVGKLAISECFQEKNCKLEDYIGKKFSSDPFGLTGSQKTIIPLPHPSGASTWFYADSNKELLRNALKIIAKEVKSHSSGLI